jgi:hypothetical protein
MYICTHVNTYKCTDITSHAGYVRTLMEYCEGLGENEIGELDPDTTVSNPASALLTLLSILTLLTPIGSTKPTKPANLLIYHFLRPPNHKSLFLKF